MAGPGRPPAADPDVARWRAEHGAAVGDTVTDSGLPVRPLYGPGDLPADHAAGLGVPGAPPYTRGVYPTMYSGRRWSIRPLAGFGTAEDTNRRMRMLLAEGATAVNTVFDYPTNRGYDSDDAWGSADAGLGGVAVDSVGDMLALYDGVPLDRVSVSLVLSHPVAAGAVLAMYLAAAEQAGYDPASLSGTLQNDFMMETVVLTAPNTLAPHFSFRLAMDVVEYCARNLPRWHPVSFTGYNYREAGADAVLEVALVVANAVATIEEMRARGLAVDEVAGSLSAFFTAAGDFFEEAAKFRSARRVYHRELTGRFAPADPRSTRLRFHVQTAGSSLTAQQPLNNVARAALQGLSAVLGGAQSLHLCAYDEALCIPSEDAALTALRTQQILLAETGAARTIDPLAGSYFVESLTDEFDRRIGETLGKIDALGGIVAAVEQGWVHTEILDRAYRDVGDVDSGKRVVVGVNTADTGSAQSVGTFAVPETLPRQRARLDRWRRSRDEAAVARALRRLDACVVSEGNTMPVLIDAARAGATLGECCQVFRDRHGGWQQPLS
ncbi:methylmalonyl-CoA mutase family protein [Kitasatospora sp. Ki12]|uniref:acyl-CoA mutase large subunit family protein n=1 Tax=Kitasatospora xanthocidica TaxID=83382 RepID=UPI00167BB903|nr:methylmalonyl-CoA mutase family protein [Kitasatospora xanthocidica]GHF89633.1 methylmalonyl-CoA mutase [Kitasatospora xanthocidica]